jgi:hypothetical protein
MTPAYVVPALILLICVLHLFLAVVLQEREHSVGLFSEDHVDFRGGNDSQWHGELAVWGSDPKAVIFGMHGVDLHAMAHDGAAATAKAVATRSGLHLDFDALVPEL